MRFRFAGGLLVAFLAAAAGLRAQIPGRNVNMVSGAGWPDGDPMLQRQNEPSIAASSRNPLHLLGGANDYRTVDLPGLPDGDETGDAWVGLFKSKDGGQRWTSNLIPGYPQDTSQAGMDSPLKGHSAAADPVVRAGSNGLLYYSGLAFNREENGLSTIFVARYIDNNNQEAGDPIDYIDTQVVASNPGVDGSFLDKPWTAVDIPRSTARTCVITTTNTDGSTLEQRLPAGAVYVAYASVWEDAQGPRSDIFLTSSNDCGATWLTPVQLSELNDRVNQGASIAIDPRNGTVHVSWRRFDLTGDQDAMMIATALQGQKFDKPKKVRGFPKQAPQNIAGIFEHRIDKRHGVAAAAPAAAPLVGKKSPWWKWWRRNGHVYEVENIAPFDAGTSEVDLSFRTNAYPTLAVDATGRVYMAWTERGFSTYDDPFVQHPITGDARIVIATSVDGVTWTTPRPVAEYQQRGHQVMPTLAFAGGRLMLAYYDLVEDRSQWFSQYIDDRSAIFNRQRRHTIDLRASMGTPGAEPVFEPSVRVSDYLFGARSATTALEQLQVNPPNLKMFRLGTVPFFGDYIDLAAAPNIVPDGSGGWRFNTEPGSTLPVFHAVWTDNRDVITPRVDVNGDGNPWNDYTPPTFLGPSPFDPTRQVPECTPGNAGSRNQNIYTARITGGLLVGSPGNTKPLSIDLQRAFVTFVQNTTDVTRSFRLTILNQPAGGRASFDQFPLPPHTPQSEPPLTVLDLTTGPRSSASRSVFVTANDPLASVVIDVSEIAMPGAPGEIPGGLEGRIVLNPDILNPEIENPEIENPEIENPEIENAEVFNPEIENPEIENPEIENPEIENPEIENPEIENPEIENIRIANPEIENPEIENVVILNPEIENPEIENPEIENPEIENGSITDITWTITNNGNTTAAFNVNVFLLGQQETLPGGIITQLIIYRTYKTPVVDQCDLKTITQNVLVANIPSPDLVTPEGGFHDPNDPSVKNATMWLAPGETASVTLRVFDEDASNNIIVDGASIDPQVVPQEDVDLVLQQQSVNSEDAENGVTEPPIITTTASTLFFLRQPANVVPDIPMAPIWIQVRDTAGEAMPGVSVTMTLGENPTAASLAGITTALTDADGIARFDTLVIDRLGVGYTLVAAVSGLTPVSSLPFAVYEMCAASGVSVVRNYRVDGPAVPDRPKFVQAGVDWSSDGREDVVIVTEGGVFHTMHNVFGAFPGYLFATGTGPGSATGVATGDFNSDGHPDVLVAKGAAQTVVLTTLIAGGAGGTQSTIPVGDDAMGVVAGRFNGDAFLDAAVVRPGVVRVLFGNGAGAFPAFVDIPGLSLGTAIAAGDLDGDGDLDLVVADPPGPVGVIHPIRNDGGGTFTLLASVPAGETPMALVTHDFDHDGHLDVAAATTGGVGGVTVRFGDGTGAFPREAAIGLGFTPSGITAGDFDGNGIGDVAVANSAANRLHIQFARPGATTPIFDNPQSFATDPLPVSVAAGDFNGDGRRDLATANRSIGTADDFNTMSVLLGACGAATADLLLTITDAQDPVIEGTTVTHTATVTNQGPFDATAVTLSTEGAALVSGVYTSPLSLVSATPSQGSCEVTNPGPIVTCAFDTVPAGAEVNLVLVYTAPAAGFTVFTGGHVTATTLDTTPANGASQQTQVVFATSFPMAIDTSALPPGSTFSVDAGGVPVIPQTAVGGVTNASLVPATYTLHVPSISTSATVDFTVTPGGVFDYAPAHDAILLGRGTATLVVRGHPITIDTRALRAGAAEGEVQDLFVASLNTDEVLRYNGETGAFAGVFAQHASLTGVGNVIVGPDGNLYAAGLISSNIVRFNGQTGAFMDEFVAAGTGGLSAPSGLAFGPDGHLYVGHRPAGPDSILKFDGQTGAFVAAFVSGALDNPLDLTFGADGLLYVASFFTNNVLRFDPATGAFLGVFASGSGLSLPTGITFGPDGNLYVTSDSTGGVEMIVRFDGTTGAFIDVFVPDGGGLSNPVAVRFGPDGDLYVSDFDLSAVLRYDGATGAFMGQFVAAGSGGLSGALLFAFHSTAPLPAPGSYILLSDNAPASMITASASLRAFNLLPGSYSFRMPFASPSAQFDFTVTATGLVDFAPALDAYVSGRGTSTLVVSGQPIAIDTSAFDVGGQYVVESGGITAGVTPAGFVREHRLLPGDYTFRLPFASGTAAFDFSVTAAGLVDFAPALDAYVSGRGTTTLVVTGHAITVDTTAFDSGAQYTVASGGVVAGVVPAGSARVHRMLPGTYSFHLPFSTPTPFEFVVTAAGTIDFAPALDGYVSGRGTSSLVVSGHAITIDTSAFDSNAQYLIDGGGLATGILNAGAVRVARLLPGSYTFHLPYSTPTPFPFTISDAGLVDFAPALDGFVSGRGTSTLVVSGYPITIDTTTFDPAAQYVLNGGGIATGILNAGAVRVARLLPGTYDFHLPYSSATPFSFTVTAAGSVDFAAALDGYVSGRGTSTLTVSGLAITIDTTALSPAVSYFIAGGGLVVPSRAAGGSVGVRLLPGAYDFASTAFTFTFSVLANGSVDFDPAFEPDVLGRGTSVLRVFNDPGTDADDLFDVTNTNDSGPGSLRQAILNANSEPGVNTIRFFVPGAGPHTITPLSPLPAISTPMVIDGTTQQGGASIPLVELDGSSAGILANGLEITGGGTWVRALTINRFAASGILMTGAGGNLVTGSFIGTDATGRFDRGNGGVGIGIGPGSNGNTIGGPGIALRNVISGNAGDGVSLTNSTGNLVRNNHIGTDVAGTADLGNSGNGVALAGASGALIGGSTAFDRNVISGNDGSGVFVTGPGAPASPLAVIRGNIIGLDVNGSNPIGNSGPGIRTLNAAVMVGGSVPGQGNIISANQDGLQFSNSGSTFNTRVLGNYIGTDGTALLDRGNGTGVIIGSAPGIIVGGENPGEGNLISGNFIGITIDNASHQVIDGLWNTKIQGNVIGLDGTGAAALPNGRGLVVSNSNNLIGGLTAGARNVISGNTNDGVQVAATAFGTQFRGNYIGTSASGSAAVGNGGSGILLAGPATIVGGSGGEFRNVISGNGGYGVRMTAGGNAIGANWIGLNAAGTAAIGNTLGGILVVGSNNAIGGPGAGEGNVVSGNGDSGIFVDGATTAADNNQIHGNFIGTNAAGSAAVPNAEDGISIVGALVTGTNIGFTTPGHMNLISGNGLNGVNISGAGAGNEVQGNRIGTNQAGTSAIPNLGGIAIVDTTGTVVGGAVAGAGNLVSGNTTFGVKLVNAPSFEVRGNRIGVTANGLGALGNGSTGVLVQGGSGTIGGDNAVTRNIISGQASGPGVRVSAGNLVFIEGNYIGLNATGTSALGNAIGVQIDESNGPSTGIGVGDAPAGQGNVISGNGVGVLASAGSGWINNNLIGTNAAGTLAVPNTSHGIEATGTAGGYQVSGTIAFNGGDGVRVAGSATGIRINARIHLNGGAGIDLGGDGVTANDALDADAGPNALQNYPVLTSVQLSPTDTTVSGTLHSTPNALFTVDLYSIAALDASGYGEGNVSFGSFVVGTDNVGNAAFNVTVPAVIPASNFVVATAIDAAGNTSEFSAGIPASALLVTNTNDAGPGSLRAAMISANAAPGAQTVIFAIPGAGPHTIAVASELPIVGDAMTIDGTTQAGYDGLPMINIDGAATTGGASGFRLEGSGSTVRGVSLTNFANLVGGYGVLVRGTGNRVEQSLIGLDRFNVSGPNRIGVYAAYAVTPWIIGNTVAASGSDGIVVAGGIDVSILDNVIGLTPDRTTERGNSGSGITIYDGSQDTQISGNTIAANLGWGIDLQQTGALAPVNETRIVNNTIGLGAGSAAMGNALGGVRIENAPDTQLGQPGGRNYISANGGPGVRVVSVTGAMPAIHSNYIGTDTTGELVRSNTNKGIELSAPALVGGSGAGEGNLLSGNGDVMGGAGLIILRTASGAVVQGNTIGLSASGAPLGNGYSGITVSAETGATIGGDTAGARNVISGNGIFGISILNVIGSDPAPSGVVVQGNYIGTDPGGTLDAGNGTAGINVVGTDHLIGGTTAGTGNLIAFNGAGGGIRIGAPAGGVQVLGNSIDSNDGLGIDLNGDGVTPNDPAPDADPGPNGFQNSPVVAGVSSTPSASEVSGSMESTPDTTFTVELFRGTTCDASGFGEGRQFLTRFPVTTTAIGLVLWVSPAIPGTLPAGTAITATATDPAGSTSEFSTCFVVP